MNSLCSLQHLQTLPLIGFYITQKLSFSSKIDISKTAWINAWLPWPSQTVLWVNRFELQLQHCPES